jgi:fibrillarin-like pre-rRNA processing protein
MWTRALVEPASVFGERVAYAGGHAHRAFDPSASKLAAAVARGWRGPIPQPGERWLYLGAAAGTTVSYVADLVGQEGAVLAVEKSPRAFARLLARLERYPNVLPILADARGPDDYSALVPPADGLYADIAQPDQVAIVLANAARFLRVGGALFFALKTASLGRSRTPEGHARASREALRPAFDPEPPLSLEPFHRRHYALGGVATRAVAAEADAGPVRADLTPRSRAGPGS